MAEATGRNRVVSWIAGVLCIAVIGALLWFAGPFLGELLNFAGDALRSLAPGE